MLNQDRLTIKAAEAIQAAAAEATRRGNPSLEDVHLLHALLDQDKTVVVPIVQKVGVNRAATMKGGYHETLARQAISLHEAVQPSSRPAPQPRLDDRRWSQQMPGVDILSEG